jgi:hypothetical protein
VWRRLVTRSVFARVERAAASVARLARTVSHHSHRSRVHVEVAVRVRDAPEGAPRRALKRRAPREAGNRAAHTAPPRAATWGSRESEGGDAVDERRREGTFDFLMMVLLFLDVELRARATDRQRRCWWYVPIGVCVIGGVVLTRELLLSIYLSMMMERTCVDAQGGAGGARFKTRHRRR